MERGVLVMFYSSKSFWKRVGLGVRVPSENAYFAMLIFSLVLD